MSQAQFPFVYTVRRSDRRTLALEIRQDLSLLVRAPQRCPEQTILRLLRDKEDWIRKSRERQRQRNLAYPEPDAAERQRLIELASVKLPERVAHYGALMGLRPTGLRITGAAKRFGSCSSRGGLCFSWRLMRYPEAAVDYVVVHELAHLAHRDHGRAFYERVASVLPDYQERLKLLKA